MSDIYKSVSKSPLNILINPTNIKSKNSWEINLTYLLELLEKILKDSKFLDLRICGSAAVTSSLIYRLKVENLFMKEKEFTRKQINYPGPLEIPTILNLPFRFELHSVSTDDLVNALQSVLDNVSDRPVNNNVNIESPIPDIEIDKAYTEINNLISEFREDLLRELDKSKQLNFNSYVYKQSYSEKIRSFILLLFIAMENLIIINQKDDEIIIEKQE